MEQWFVSLFRFCDFSLHPLRTVSSKPELLIFSSLIFSGESLRKLGFESEDRISELPEALILGILSFLPTKDVIATSVLSKQWGSLWKMVPKLEFESNDQKFAENVTRSLLSHKAPVLERLQLKLSDKCEAIDVELERWAGIAISRNVREFVLKIFLSFGPSVTLPSSLFCSDTLETLKLNNGISLIVPCSVSMKSLRTLHLHGVKYKDEESFRNLLSGCPNLEDLQLHRYYPNNVTNVIIVSPSLKRLSIWDYRIGLENNGGYVINAPCLEYLYIGNLKGHEFCLIENAPMLVEAKVRNVSDIVNEKILGSLISVKRLVLELSPLEIEYPSGSIFYQLVSLEMCTRKDEWWNLLALMLDSSPKLQVLKLIDQYPGYKSVGMVGRNWNEPKYVPECLLSHLETFEWINYSWKSEQEQEVATYILRSARHLKKATFSTRPIYSIYLNKLENRRKMLNELDCVVKASKSCHLVFQ
ncbi:F-box/FBD/LRR-repeat protein [Cardamine amara subsp. amara]|uniref:F-box/FBD/LRR-repeat protein n=1 Tax=Cardamine amara subsp. amara TaxID=228776 RepID=A0ABD0ZZ66_CARAN